MSFLNFHVKLKFLSPVAFLVVIVAFSIGIAIMQHQPVNATVAEARAFADDWCGDDERRLADYMWLTAPDGSRNISVVQGTTERVRVKINVFVTYCAQWGNHNNGAENIGMLEDFGGGRLVNTGRLSYGKNINYVDRAQNGVRREWGVATYDATLNVAGWAAGGHVVCSTFKTFSSKPDARFFDSPSACFKFNLTRIQPWSITGRSYTSVNSTNVNRTGTITGAPGQTVRWRHTVTNNGPGYITPNTIGYKVEGFGSDNTTEAKIAQRLNGGDVFTRTTYFNVNQKRYVDARYNITQADVGRNLCQFITSWPHSYNWQSSPPNWRRSAQACVNVPYNFTLRPLIDVPLQVVETDQELPDIIPRVNNAGPTKSDSNVRWVVSRIVVPVGGSIPENEQENGTQPCGHYANQPGAGCEVRAGNTEFSVGTETISDGIIKDDKIEDLEAGQRVCYGLSVRQYTHANTDWRHSAASCVVVGKKPKVQIWGGDLRADLVDTSISTKQINGDERTFGSWVEYGVFAQTSAQISSGAGLAGTDGSGTDCASTWNKLTFANEEGDCVGNNFGQYTQSSNVASMASALLGKFNIDSARALPSTVNVTNVVNDNAAVRRTGSLTLNGGTVEPGKWGVLYATGTVRITGNIDYSDASLSDPSDIPQLVIVAPNIEITPDVTNVDAWLVAARVNASTGSVTGGTVNTCYRSGSQALTVSRCNRQLTITGPVVADELLLRRTAGSGVAGASNDPAEIINLRADAYLWAMSQTQGSQRAQTVYTKDLAPRF